MVSCSNSLGTAVNTQRQNKGYAKFWGQGVVGGGRGGGLGANTVYFGRCANG